MRSISWIRIALLSAVLTWITSNFWATRARRSALKSGHFPARKTGHLRRPLASAQPGGVCAAHRADLWLAGHDFHCAAQPGCERQQWRYQGRAQARAALAYPALRGANQLLNASAALAALEAL